MPCRTFLRRLNFQGCGNRVVQVLDQIQHIFVQWLFDVLEPIPVYDVNLHFLNQDEIVL